VRVVVRTRAHHSCNDQITAGSTHTQAPAGKQAGSTHNQPLQPSQACRRAAPKHPPIMMMPSVCGSFTNRSRQSTKLVPGGRYIGLGREGRGEVGGEEAGHEVRGSLTRNSCARVFVGQSTRPPHSGTPPARPPPCPPAIPPYPPYPPLKGSPPMPTTVLCPSPWLVVWNTAS
jgi:hypothetical protein